MAHPPCDCPGHSLPCKVLTVRKDGDNFGRPFYVCAQSPQCRFFQWADVPIPQRLPRARAAVIVGTDVRLSVLDDDQLRVEFKYDDTVKDLCREFASARYSPEAGAWLVPTRHQEELQRKLRSLEAAGTINSLRLPPQLGSGAPSLAAATAAASRAQPPSSSQPPPQLRLPPTLEAGLMPHQREAVDFVVAHELRGLVADDMGLGKTVTAIAVLAHARRWPALVVCPASVKYNWKAELLRWLPEELTPAQVQVVDAGNEAIDPAARVLVETYAGARTRGAKRELDGFTAIVCDESHNLKTPEAQQTRIMLPLLRRAAAVVLLSGTPALSRPAELWTQASVVAPSIFPANGYEAFGNTYCGGRDDYNKFSGATNLAELEEKMLKHVMIRRGKEEVLEALCPKRRCRVKLEQSDAAGRAAGGGAAGGGAAGGDVPRGAGDDAEQARRDEELAKRVKHMKRLKHRLDQTCAGEVVEFDGARLSRDQLLQQHKLLITDLYRKTCAAKQSHAVAHVARWCDAHPPQQKLLVFAHHSEMLDALVGALKAKGVGTLRIDGGTSAKRRQALVEAFQNTGAVDSPRVALLSIRAAGQGITLTAAAHVTFAEWSWTPSEMEQCIDRAHRLGQKAAEVRVEYLKYGPFDDTMWALLQNKQRVLTESGVGGAPDGTPRSTPTKRPVSQPTTPAAMPPASPASASASASAPRSSPAPTVRPSVVGSGSGGGGGSGGGPSSSDGRWPGGGQRLGGGGGAGPSRPACPFGAACYRQNPAHFREYSHPADDVMGGGGSGKRQRVGSPAWADSGSGGAASSSGAVVDLTVDADANGAMLAAGTLVRLKDLTARPELNGRRGVVLRFDTGSQRYFVSVRRGEEPEEIAIKAENLAIRG